MLQLNTYKETNISHTNMTDEFLKKGEAHLSENTSDVKVDIFNFYL